MTTSEGAKAKHKCGLRFLPEALEERVVVGWHLRPPSPWCWMNCPDGRTASGR